MARIFISYSRADTLFIEELIPLLRRAFPGHDLWYDREITGGEDWWNRILSEIAACDLFIYLLSNDSLESKYCQNEITEALRLQKAILPIYVRAKTRLDRTRPDLAGELSRRQIVDLSRGFADSEAFTELYRAIQDKVNTRPAEPPQPLTPTPTPLPLVDRASRPRLGRLSLLTALLAVIVLAAAIIGITALSGGESNVPATQSTLTATYTVTPTEPPTFTPSPTSTLTATGTLTATASPTVTPTHTAAPTSTPTATDTAAPTTPHAAWPLNQVLIAGTEVWLREQPDSDSWPPTAKAPAGSTLVVLEAEPRFNSGLWWWYVRWEIGNANGWVEEPLLAVFVPSATPRPGVQPPQITTAPIAPAQPVPTQPPACNFNLICEKPQESSLTCPSDCPTPAPPLSSCNFDFICQRPQENSSTCPSDCPTPAP